KNAVYVGRASSTKQILGIVSTKPGFYLGGFNDELYANETKVPVALAGRVPTKVNLEGGPIAVGDSITLSSIAGVGAKATTTGVQVGIALEPYDGTGTSTIEVFVHLGTIFAGLQMDANQALSEFASSSTSTPIVAGSFMDGFLHNLYGKLVAWLGDANNGIDKM